MLLKSDLGKEAPDEMDIVREEEPADGAASRQDDGRDNLFVGGAKPRSPQTSRMAARAGQRDDNPAHLADDSTRAIPPSRTAPLGSSLRPGPASAQGLPPLADRVKRPADALDGRRLAEFWAAKQSERVARKVESSIAATPQLGAVHPNVIMRLMQALMRILRLLFEKLGVHERPKDQEKKDERGQEPKANVRFHAAESAPSGPAEPARTDAASRTQPAEAVKANQESVELASKQVEPSVPTAAETATSSPEITPATTAADLVTAAFVRASDDPQIRRRMDEVGQNSSLQTAIYMAAVVNDLRSMARLVQDRLSAYGGAMNLRLARYQVHCQTFGGHTAAALLLQNGVIQPRDISAAFAEEVKGITARHQPHLDELNLLRLAVTEAAREVYQCTADSPIREQLLAEMDGSLTDLLGKDWRKSLALERLGAAPDEAEIAELVQRVSDAPDVGDFYPDSADQHDVPEFAHAVSDSLQQGPDQSAPRIDGSADSSPSSPGEDLTSPPSMEAGITFNVDSEPAASFDGAAPSLPVDKDEAGSEAMSRDEAVAQFALLEANSSTTSSGELAPVEAHEDYARERG
ncbi:hypothetical protein AXYL_06887 (plasmid) [Achromobacter xylosoxidans A8]|uniref:Uncharacterized protein n=1 Tax=Achromobacter xylosoxidans (strain A8) TaxID=762376 RepID=E3HYL5_ACHXA|nr:hypothetical protein [Achromobacter xylosoxidans]ADP20169.1 hypothetical protein AXYL_06887 [Achromobacter xylosoxidans A8]